MLEALARQGARTLLQQALENEVAEYIEAHAAKREEKGHRLAVPNGTMPERSILTRMGPMEIRQPRVDDRKLKEQERAEGFSSRILPRYLRRVPSVDNLIPVLYLKGLSSADGTDRGMWDPDCHLDDGVQIGDGSSEELEEVDRFLDHSHGVVGQGIRGWGSERECSISGLGETRRD